MKKLNFIWLVISISVHGQGILHPQELSFLTAAQYSPRLATAISFCLNPSVLTDQKGAGVALYSENRFVIQGLNLFSLCGMVAGSNSAVGLNFQYFGVAGYQETLGRISYGKSLGKINIGAAFGYHTLNIAGIIRQSSLLTHISATLVLSEKTHASLQVINPHVSGSRSGKWQTASLYKTGISQNFSRQVDMGIELIKEEDKNIRVVSVIYYRLSPRFFARTGYITGAQQIFFGAGWQWNVFRTEILATHHPSLGISPALLLIFQRDHEANK